MKNHLFRFLAVTLAILCVIPLAACGGNGDQKTDKATEKVTDPATVPATEPATAPTTDPETDPEAEAGNNRTDNSICFIGDQEEDDESLFYDSLQEAVNANPQGCNIKLCVDELTIDALPDFPEGAEYSITFNWAEVEWNVKAGVILEYMEGKHVDYIYYTSLDKLFADKKGVLHNTYIWFFGSVGEYTPGKYRVTDKNIDKEFEDPDYLIEFDKELEFWGQKYLAEADGVHYYTLQEAVDNAKTDAIVKVNPCDSFIEKETIQMPVNACWYRIPYNYLYIDCTFDLGLTYDDTMGGLCYYSSFDHLSNAAGLANTYMWVWTDMEGYKPGKYFISVATGEPDGAPGEDGNVSVFSLNKYTFTWIDDLSGFRKNLYGDDYELYYPDGE